MLHLLCCYVINWYTHNFKTKCNIITIVTVDVTSIGALNI